MIPNAENPTAFNPTQSMTRELMNCSEGTVIYHTANENITIEVKNIRAYRGRI
ncbi:hypothetical protein [Clostridium neonatale]|uniref:hypothetical protein n=1 Tax=Clostridium neonatale TaxID=137838 RepID=UPI000AB7A38E|nr:hypothetical protein [Clostridium neonatale]CAH0437702.1 Conserved hypothetical protein [Clostridium neonatale]CAI3236680.1 Conserved hypothetical protein [Clostridium neonatale]CAI3242446.1 Conserved hypothetical protein [Clostridium neonatale]CAI3552975.1 Conserved hypothetical protein [Clostridium neonatale]